MKKLAIIIILFCCFSYESKAENPLENTRERESIYLDDSSLKKVQEFQSSNNNIGLSQSQLLKIYQDVFNSDGSARDQICEITIIEATLQTVF